MTKTSTFLPLVGVLLDRKDPTPLHRQLYHQLGEAVLERRLVPGTRLPSTRALSEELSISRNTVINAFSQLLAEGYIEGKIGSGTYVSQSLPDDILHLRQIAVPPSLMGRDHPSISNRGSVITATPVNPWVARGRPRAFRPTLPAVDEFPFAIWSRLARSCWRDVPGELLDYGHPAGYGRLRAAIGNYLNASRGVRCSPEQVIVVAGSQQALDLAARLLLDPGDSVWFEDPGYRGAVSVSRSVGAKPVPVPVDDEGLDVHAALRRARKARMVYVTPSHQFPLGMTMSLARRLTLLDWAQSTDAWILEDDYDGEYRYAGQPLPALQGLDTAGRVIYIGTFSKVLFPALRLGYLVVPPDLVGTFVRARELMDRQPPILEQMVLADFIEGGYFARHLRRMRSLYRVRRATILEEGKSELGDLLEIAPPEAGLHLVAWLPERVDDREVCKRLAAAEVEAVPLSAYAMSRLHRGALLLGYAAFDERAIHEGMRTLRHVLSAE